MIFLYAKVDYRIVVFICFFSVFPCYVIAEKVLLKTKTEENILYNSN
jgi:hypothetical protein